MTETTTNITLINVNDIANEIYDSNGIACPICINFQCKKHRVLMDLLTRDDEIIQKPFTLRYCDKCKLFFVSAGKLIEFSRLGIPLCNVISYHYTSYLNNNGTFSRREYRRQICSKDYVKHLDALRRGQKGLVDFDYSHSNDNRIIHTRKNICFNDGNDLQDINGKVNVITDDGSVVEMYFVAAYCTICERYYIFDNEYKRLRKTGALLCHILAPSLASEQSLNNDFSNWNQESALHMYGYSVDINTGLTNDQRQMLLYYLVSNNLLTRFEIIAHLELLIRLNSNKETFESAIYKWQSDIDFLNNVRFDSIPEGQITSIKVIRNVYSIS